MTRIVPNGYTDLPDGHAAAIAIFMQMRSPPPPADDDRPDLDLVRERDPEAGAYRALFRRVGQDWLWNSRLRLDDQALSAILCDPAVELYIPSRAGEPIGILELDFREAPSVELAFFGLVREAVGSGAGRWLMNRALELAWRPGIERVWLHTCTFDHPFALDFYRRSGFVAYARKLEMFPDPRLDGTLPADAARHVPLIGRYV
jgi:GNAT superfamily N-acetyltransferase